MFQPLTAPRGERAADAGIGGYGLIGDGRTAALISRDGDIDWLCLPIVSSPSIFAGMLDDAGGRCALRPAGLRRSSRRYRRDTAILETEFHTETGSARIVDFFPIEDGPETLCPLRQLVRIVEGLQGTVDFDVLVDPRPEYGQAEVRPRQRGRLGWHYSWCSNVLAVQTEVPLTAHGPALRGTFTIGAGARKAVILAFSQGDVGVYAPLAEAQRDLQRTQLWWEGWSGCCRYHGPYREQVVRSAITLKLLAHCLSGAIVAAPTASLPEALGFERNWDYRYCWLRDAGLTVQALTQLGYMEEADAFLGWLLHATRLTWPKLQVVYDVYGRARLQERELKHLHGYAGSKPVRIGNAASDQMQLDVYGEVLLAAEAFVAGGGTLDSVEQRMLCGFGKVAAQEWSKPDHGIWEIRGERRHYTFSKLMCWLALDRLLSLDRRGALQLGRLKTRLRDARDQIARAIESLGFNSQLRAYTATFEGDALDSSLLLMAAFGYRPAQPDRLASTIERVWTNLGEGPWVRRYAQGFDGEAGREGAFLVLSFWTVQSLCAQERFEEARALFASALASANSLGLMAEEIDPRSGQFLGNFPQAFCHTGLINAALALEAAG